MKLRTLGLALVGALAFASVTAPARAEVMDMAAVPCNDLISGSADDAGIIIIWMHGYFSGKTDDTKIDMKALEKDAERIGKYCGEHKNVTVLTAIKDVANQ